MTDAHVVSLHGSTVMVCSPDGLPLDSERAAADLIGEAASEQAGVVVIPVERLTDEFFQLSSGLAGELAQKFSTYRLRMVVVGDVEARAAANASLSAWIGEANRGDDVWFVPTFEDFTERFEAV